MCRLPLSGNHTTTLLRSTWSLVICVTLVFTAQATTAKTSSTPKKQEQHKHQRGCGPTDHQLCRSRLLQPEHRGVPATGSNRGKGVRSSAWLSARAERRAWTVRGGQHSNNRDEAEGGGGEQNFKREGEQTRYFPDFPAPPGARDQQDGVNAAAEKIEKIAADFRTKTDDLAADVRARGEAISADLKAKQEKITDEVLRDRSPEAFGELGGHHSPYDSTTAGMDVANRRAFFLGIRRVVLVAQVVELIIACSWQAAFPYGGVAGFVASGGDSPTTTSGGQGGDGTGRLGLAVAAALGQAAVYTIMLAFFGCDRVVLKAVNVTGWEHVAAAAWVLTRAFGAPGKLPHLAACAWLAGMAFLCLYFGRQL